ncbi:MAG: cysteine desulfurase [Bdellovibrionales bacterium]|nr:cysteine desulfurase [Bdellovibrionales bacterium]
MNTPKRPIYFDYNATTPVLPSVFEAMKPYFTEEFGNPSSLSHSYGWSANMAVEKAREQIASALHCRSKEVYFTSGATESNNLAILGLVTKLGNQEEGSAPHFITSQAEHKSVLEVCRLAQTRFGAEITIIDPDRFGQVSLKQIQQSVQPNTRLISVMMANNEIGTINPIAEIGKWAKSQNILFHTDCAQSFGKLPIHVEDMAIDILSLSGHKIYGPKGVGVLFVRSENPSVELLPLLSGGTQEHGIRPGTLNVPGIVGLGAATELALSDMSTESERLKALQKHLISGVLSQLPEATLNGHPTERLATNVSFSFSGLSADIFALGLNGLALSAGSACASGTSSPSHVLKAIGHSDRLARATVRFGLGRLTTFADIKLAIDKIVEMVVKSRQISIV